VHVAEVAAGVEPVDASREATALEAAGDAAEATEVTAALAEEQAAKLVGRPRHAEADHVAANEARLVKALPIDAIALVAGVAELAELAEHAAQLAQVEVEGLVAQGLRERLYGERPDLVRKGWPRGLPLRDRLG